MSKKKRHTKPGYPKDKDWVDITVDIHDGWADDVALVYPEGSWRPDEGELTTITVDDGKASDDNILTADSASETDSADSLADEKDFSAKEPKTKHYFRMFLIIWLGTLSIVIALALGYFYDFLDSYEQVYQTSRPYHMMDEIMTPFRDMDMNTIYQMMTVQPVISEFETEETVKAYMAQLLNGKKITYEEASHFNSDFPEYLILADGYVVADVSLRKSQTDVLEYGFPVWYVSSFEFYTQPLEDFFIEAPENYVVYVNGIAVSEEYFLQNAAPEENAYTEPYATLPNRSQYYCEGLYAQPTVTAIDSFGKEYMILPTEENGDYIIPYPTDCENAQELKDYAVEVVTAYANYVSNDTPDNALDVYFPADSILLPLIKANTSRQFYPGHQTPVIQNVEIKNFIVYSEDVYYCEVYLEQSMKLSWGGEPEIVPTDGRFYFVNIDGEWKVSAIAY